MLPAHEAAAGHGLLEQAATEAATAVGASDVELPDLDVAVVGIVAPHDVRHGFGAGLGE